jgi:hypothetical protein
MANVHSWGGSVNTTSMNTGIAGDYFYSDPIGMPTGELAANGNRPIRVESCAHAYLTNGYSAIYYQGTLTTGGTTFPTSAGTFQFRGIRTGGTANVGRNSAGGGTTYFASGPPSFAGIMPGSLAWSTVPTAPTIGACAQTSPVSASLAWSAPASDGASAITGYRILYATNSSFTGATTLDVGNVTSYEITGLTPGVQYWFKVAALNLPATSASTSSVFSADTNVVLVAEIGDLDGWASYGTLPAGLTAIVTGALRRGGIYSYPGQPSGLMREIQRTGSGGPVTTETLGIRRTFTGLTIGATYKLTGQCVSLQNTTPPGNLYAFYVQGIGSGSTGATTDASTLVTIPDYTFVATASSHVIGITLKEAASWSGSGWWEAVGFLNLKLYEIPNVSPYRLQDTAYQGPLSTHFAYACDTVGAAWWVDRENVTQFRQAESQDTLVATFTDIRAPGALEYVDIAASYDTRNVVNALTINNHGRDSGTGNADDVTTNHLDATSVTAWGARVGQLDMTMRRALVYDATNLFTDPSTETGTGTTVVGTNLVANPSGETATTGYVADPGASGVAAVTNPTATTAFGTKVLRVTWTTASTAAGGAIYTDVPVTAGVVYSFGWGHVKPSITNRLRTHVQWLNGSNALVGSASISAQTVVAAGTVNSTAFKVENITAPAGAVKARVTVDSVAGTSYANWSVASYLEVDGFMFNAGPTVLPYFDGATAASGDFTYAWTGTANASTSVLRGVPVTNVGWSNAVAIKSAAYGGSMRVIPTTDNVDSYAEIGALVSGGLAALAVNTMYTIAGKLKVPYALTGSTGTPSGSQFMSIFVYLNSSYVAIAGTYKTNANTPGEYEFSGTFTTPASLAGVNSLRLYNGAAGGGGSVYWTDLLLVPGTYTGPYFDGSTATSQDYAHSWSGIANASTSVRTRTLTAIRAEKVLDDYSEPAVRISAIRWNAQENPALAARLDIQDRVRVEFRGTVQDSRIVGIRHDLSGTRWMVDLDLIKS